MNDVLYGTTKQGGQYFEGTVFRVTTSGTEHVLHSFGSGTGPLAGLIDVNGVLYGTTVAGMGIVFTVTTSGSEKLLYSFL